MALSNLAVRNAKPESKPRKLYDERGLYLLVNPTGSKLWQFKYRIHDKEKKLSFGAYPDVSLAEAREKRDEARKLVAQKVDPAFRRKEEARAAKLAHSSTFTAVAREFIARRVSDGICERTRSKNEWLLSLLAPVIGNRPIGEITTPELHEALTRIGDSGRRETARRLRSFAGRVFVYAAATGRTERNPANNLRRQLAVPSVRHHPAIIETDELRDLLIAIESYGGYPSTIGALRLSPHLFQRPGEIRNMRWTELDLARSRWVIPSERMKMRKEHSVPLSRQAKAIIEGMTATAGRSEFVFPAFHTWRKPLSENSVNQALRRLGFAGKMTAHGFRSTASSLLNESGEFSADSLERALAHKDKNQVRETYNRSTYWPERVRMMQWWSDYLDRLKEQRLC